MYLLSTQALLQIASRNTENQIMQLNIPENQFYLSTITIGQAFATVEKRAQSHKKQGWIDSLNQIVSEHEDNRRIFDIDLNIAKRWAQLREIELKTSNGGDVGQDTRLVLATALSHSKIYISKTELYHNDLHNIGLKILDPWRS